VFRKLLILALCTPVALAAQASGSSGAPEPSAPTTPFEHIVDKLGLDVKTQVPEAEKLFNAQARLGASIGVEMVNLRKKMLDLEFAEKTADVAPVLESYTAAAAKMTGLEADTFVKLMAILKPNQQGKVAKAFPYMAGFFKPQPPRGRGPRRGGVE